MIYYNIVWKIICFFLSYFKLMIDFYFTYIHIYILYIGFIDFNGFIDFIYN